MNLDRQDTWKTFRFGSLVTDVYKSKALNKDDLQVADCLARGIRYITRTNENNGCEMIASVEGISSDYIEAGNAISIGDTTATCFYQKEPFITGDHMVIVRAEWLNEINAMYIITMLNLEKYKYSYGRAFLVDRIRETMLKLPVDKYGKPDWQFMEQYVRSLHHKPLTTKNRHAKVAELNTTQWKEFALVRLFKVEAGNYYSKDLYEEGNTPYISASDTNNGIGEKINLQPDFSGNKITIGKVGATAYYQSEDFCATSDVNVLTPLFHMNTPIGLFITQVINTSENYKWSYGRQCRVGDTKEIVIKLPIKQNAEGIPVIDVNHQYSDKGYVPDWQFMEDYIKSLPYGDRL